MSLEYKKPDGSLVDYRKVQMITCVDASQTVPDIIELFYLNPPGKIGEITSNVRDAEITRPNGLDNEVNFRIVFDPPLTVKSEPFEKDISCEFIDAFTGETEWFNVFLVGDCTEEIFEVKFLNERVCTAIFAEKIAEDGSVLTRMDDFERVEFFDGVGFRFRLTPPHKYKVTWQFNTTQ